MKKLLKIALVLAVVGILAAAYVWFFVYNKPHKNYEKAKPEAVLSAADCFQSFASNGGQLTGQVLQLNGVPSYVEDQDSLVIVVFVFNEGMFGDEGIRCTMLENHNQSTLALNTSQDINIKGLCTGYNGTDVIMEHCSIVNQ
jgi:type II secretory pathway pseudopilin PulG